LKAVHWGKGTSKPTENWETLWGRRERKGIDDDGKNADKPRGEKGKLVNKNY